MTNTELWDDIWHRESEGIHEPYIVSRYPFDDDDKIWWISAITDCKPSLLVVLETSSEVVASEQCASPDSFSATVNRLLKLAERLN